jgi:group I intron endonuclease
LPTALAEQSLPFMKMGQWKQGNNNIFDNKNLNNKNKGNSSIVYVTKNRISRRGFSTSTFAFDYCKAKAKGHPHYLDKSKSGNGLNGKDRKGFTALLPNITSSAFAKQKDKQNSEELNKFILYKNLNPVFIYDNLSDSTIKTRVLNETRGLSGIYLILNKFTMDYYVGSASTGKFHARFTNHLFNLNGSKVLKNAVKKYGISSFAFIVLELFTEIVNKENNKKLLNLEDFYLKSLLPNYNILTEAGSSFGYKHSEITRINMKSNYSEERRKAIGSLNKGKSLSPNTIELMRQAALTQPNYSAEAIKNMKKRSKPILVYNLDYTVYGEFPSIVDAAKSLGCAQKTIIRALQSPKKILRRR